MTRIIPRACNLTVDQLTEERPKRASFSGAMRYLSNCTPEERVEALARVDAAFAEIVATPAQFIGPGIPQARSKSYLKKNLVPVTFVMLEDHRADRGTMRASTDGSFRRAFNFRTTGLIVEERAGSLFLAGIPRRTRTWINQKFVDARLGWSHGQLDGNWTDEQRATWARFREIADLTEHVIDKDRAPPPSRRTYVGINPW